MKPSIPKGTRDFSPAEMLRRDYIFDSIRSVFRMSGYQPLETPAMENLSTLLGKYGEEGDKLLFRVLNSGDFLSGVSPELFSGADSQKISQLISEKGLRYDLTVPFARYVVQHQNELTFPFKRYQIQPVWRADRPQKGRYREFFQCDVDVIGSDSLLNELELVSIIDKVFSKLGVRILIKMNNRKILTGIAEITGEAERITDITVSIDKIDKIGFDAVIEEMKGRGISEKAISQLVPVLELSGSADDKLSKLENILAASETGLKGIAELRTIFSLVKKACITSDLEFDITLARGLNYYTGAIIEVKSKDVSIGSICGGGRYDDLTGIFGLPGVSGVGVSFGADRIYDVMTALNLFESDRHGSVSVLIVNFGDETIDYALSVLKNLQDNGIASELYPDSAKMKKQFAWADAKKIPWVIIAGDDEIKSGTVTLKNMSAGVQQVVAKDKIAGIILGD